MESDRSDTVLRIVAPDRRSKSIPFIWVQPRQNTAPSPRR